MYASHPAQKPVAAARNASTATSAAERSAEHLVPATYESEAAVRNAAPTMFAKRGGRASSSGALAEARLDELEVREAREAVPAAERQPDDELEREQREQPPPAGDDCDSREHSDDDLVEARRARVDDVEVAVRVREPWRLFASLCEVLHCTLGDRRGVWRPTGYARAQTASASTTVARRCPSLVRTYSTSGGRASRTSRRRTPACSSSIEALGERARRDRAERLPELA